MPTRTILWIPIAHRRHAEENGARYDAVQGVWYVDGEVPAALREYVPHPARTTNNTTNAPPPYHDDRTASERGIHLSRILSLLRQYLKNDEGILMWLTEIRSELGGKSALEMMGTGAEFRHVEALILDAFDFS